MRIDGCGRRVAVLIAAASTLLAGPAVAPALAAPPDLASLLEGLVPLEVPDATAYDGHGDADFSPVPELIELSRATKDLARGESHWTALSVLGTELYGLDMEGFEDDPEPTGPLVPLVAALGGLSPVLCPESARGPAEADGVLVCIKVLDIGRPEPYTSRDREVEGGIASVRVAVTGGLTGFLAPTNDQRFHLLYSGASSFGGGCTVGEAALARNDYIYGYPTDTPSSHFSALSARRTYCPDRP